MSELVNISKDVANILVFVGHSVSAATPQLLHSNRKIAIDNL
jgi:hypothetical protein